MDPKEELQQGRNAADAAEQARPCTDVGASDCCTMQKWCRDGTEANCRQRWCKVVALSQPAVVLSWFHGLVLALWLCLSCCPLKPCETTACFALVAGLSHWC